jgi:2-C-methyl-D-erythritol 4-phosphate cytidylyltransferase
MRNMTRFLNGLENSRNGIYEPINLRSRFTKCQKTRNENQQNEALRIHTKVVTTRRAELFLEFGQLCFAIIFCSPIGIEITDIGKAYTQLFRCNRSSNHKLTFAWGGSSLQDSTRCSVRSIRDACTMILTAVTRSSIVRDARSSWLCEE